jgi:hypothetical protein
VHIFKALVAHREHAAQDCLNMDVSDCPSIAICTGGQDHACHIVPSLEDAQTLCRTGTAEHLTDRNSFQYQGPSMKHLAAVSSMVATVKGIDCFAILSVKVPGVLENWPHVLFGSRVHIAYQAWFLVHHARSGQSFTLICITCHVNGDLACLHYLPPAWLQTDPARVHAPSGQPHPPV